MENLLSQAKITGWEVPISPTDRTDEYSQIYESARYRLFSLAYWMTGDEVAAENITSRAFQRAFVASCTLHDELLDKILVSELREVASLGVLSLDQPLAAGTTDIRGNVKKAHLEEAVMQLPATERLIFLLHDVGRYEHGRISRTVNISEAESQLGLHAARLRIRELLATMV
jgi:RNA polymerase sigma-70 factor, ECF subfamily